MKNLELIIYFSFLILILNSCEKETKSDLSPEACFTYSDSVNIQVKDSVKFNNCSNNANEFLWDFGDGFSSTEIEPYHRYDSIGDYNILLVASSESGLDSISHNISINRKILSIYDTLSGSEDNCCLSVDLDYDGINDIRFGVGSYNVGSSGCSQMNTIKGLNGCEIAYLTKYDSTNWIDNLTTYTVHTYSQPANLYKFDTISNKLGYSDSYLVVYEWDNSWCAWSYPDNYMYIDRDDLIGIGEYYIAFRINNNYGWIKIETPYTSKIIIYESYYSESNEYLVIQ